MDYAVSTKELTKQYRNKTAVNHLNLEIKKGEFFGLLGVNGAGKSTLVRMLCCLTPPTQGDAFVFGHSITEEANAVKSFIGISPQETAVAMQLTVRENLMLMAGLHGYSKKEASIRVEKSIADFHLSEIVNEKAKTLSGGWQRRVSLALATINEPQLLFLDEPTLGLDVIARRELWKYLETLHGKTTVVLTTHYLEEVEALCDRICVMQNGNCKAIGTVDELCKQSNCESLEDAFIALCKEENK